MYAAASSSLHLQSDASGPQGRPHLGLYLSQRLQDHRLVFPGGTDRRSQDRRQDHEGGPSRFLPRFRGHPYGFPDRPQARGTGSGPHRPLRADHSGLDREVRPRLRLVGGFPSQKWEDSSAPDRREVQPGRQAAPLAPVSGHRDVANEVYEPRPRCHRRRYSGAGILQQAAQTTSRGHHPAGHQGATK